MTARKSLNLEKSLAGLESLVEELEGGVEEDHGQGAGQRR